MVKKESYPARGFSPLPFSCFLFIFYSLMSAHMFSRLCVQFFFFLFILHNLLLSVVCPLSLIFLCLFHFTQMDALGCYAIFICVIFFFFFISQNLLLSAVCPVFIFLFILHNLLLSAVSPFFNFFLILNWI